MQLIPIQPASPSLPAAPAAGAVGTGASFQSLLSGSSNLPIDGYDLDILDPVLIDDTGFKPIIADDSAEPALTFTSPVLDTFPVVDAPPEQPGDGLPAERHAQSQVGTGAQPALIDRPAAPASAPIDNFQPAIERRLESPATEVQTPAEEGDDAGLRHRQPLAEPRHPNPVKASGESPKPAPIDEKNPPQNKVTANTIGSDNSLSRSDAEDDPPTSDRARGSTASAKIDLSTLPQAPPIPAVERAMQVELQARSGMTEPVSSIQTAATSIVGLEAAGSDLSGGPTLGQAASGEAVERTETAESRPILNRVIRGMHSMINHRGGLLSIKLHPPQLGHVRVQMMVHGQRVTAMLEAETPQAHGLLRANLGALQTALEQHGLSVERLSVQLAPQNAQAESDVRQEADEQGSRDRDAAQGESRGRRDRDERAEQAAGFAENFVTQQTGSEKGALP